MEKGRKSNLHVDIASYQIPQNERRCVDKDKRKYTFRDIYLLTCEMIAGVTFIYYLFIVNKI